MAQKRGPELGQDEEPDSKRQAVSMEGAALKLLLTEAEAFAVYGPFGAMLEDLQKASCTEMRLSNPDKLYPGTSLQQLNICGDSEGPVLACVAQVYMKVTEQLGNLPSCETQVLKPGDARIKMIVPTKVAKAFLGDQGKIIKELREKSGAHSHIELQSFPPNGTVEGSEQVMSFDGPLSGIQLGLQQVSTEVMKMTSEPWFSSWAETSYAGTPAGPGFMLFQDHTKPKGGPKGHPTQQFDGIMALKFLVYDFEGSSVLGPKGSRIRELSEATQTKIMLTARTEFYPGTQLQELRIWGKTEEPVLDAAAVAVSRLAYAGKPQETIPEGGPGPQCEIRLKLLVPLAIVNKLTENGGALLQNMQDQSSFTAQFSEEGVDPKTLLVEQVLNLSGPLGGARAALACLTGLFSTVIDEPWFAEWSAQSQCTKPDDAGNATNGGLDAEGLAVSQVLALMKTNAQAQVPQDPLAEARAQVQAEAKAQAMAKTKARAEAEAQAMVEIEREAQETGMQSLMAMVMRKTRGKNITDKGQKAMTIQMELLMEMEMMMEKELTAEMEAMGKGATVKRMILKRKGLEVEEDLEGLKMAGELIANVRNLMSNANKPATLANVASPEESSAMPPVPGLSFPGEGSAESPGVAPDQASTLPLGLFPPEVEVPPSVLPDPPPDVPQAPEVPAEVPPAEIVPEVAPEPEVPLKAPVATADLNSKPGMPVGIKFLVDAVEVQCIQAQDPGMVQLNKTCGARIMLSKETYPGCVGLQEIRILAPSAMALLNAMIAVFSKITEITGKLSCGEPDIQFGHACIKMLVPRRAAAAVIGPGGQNVKQLNEMFGVTTNVDMNSIPCTKDMAEQGICLAGSMEQACSAIPTILSHVETFASEKWFKAWITTSNCGKFVPNLVLWGNKGRGRGLIAPAPSLGTLGLDPLLSIPPPVQPAPVPPWLQGNQVAHAPVLPAGSDNNSLLMMLAAQIANRGN